jgi:hypothetical protein
MFFNILNEKLSANFLLQSLQANSPDLYVLKTEFIDKISKASLGLRLKSSNVDYEELVDYLTEFKVDEFQEKLETFIVGVQTLRENRPKKSKATQDNRPRQELLNFLQASWFQLGKI